MIERRSAGPPIGVDHDELSAFGRGDAVPEAAVGQPGWSSCDTTDEPGRIGAEELLGAGVVLRGKDTRGLCGRG